MKSLALLCQDDLIPEKQKEIFCREVLRYVSSEEDPVDTAITCLRNLWIRYDSGGISAGRSLRSAILEEVLFEIVEKRLSSRTRVLLSVLLGMYHSGSYINEQEWYDYPVGHFSESDVLHRVWLACAAFCLDIDDVAEMSEWPIARIKRLLLRES